MNFKKFVIIKLVLLINFLINQGVFADNHDIYEILESIKKDIKTLEKAVYSGSPEVNGLTDANLNSSN